MGPMSPPIEPSGPAPAPLLERPTLFADLEHPPVLTAPKGGLGLGCAGRAGDGQASSGPPTSVIAAAPLDMKTELLMA